MTTAIHTAAERIRSAKHVTAFTGAGISVESGIPPFRGAGGLWNRYDPRSLDIEYFIAMPEESWRVIREIFYDLFLGARPNGAHFALARMEQSSMLQAIITQNIDSLHQAAGSETVYEFHGNARMLVCLDCYERLPAHTEIFEVLPPRCPCGGLYKPDFVFFGEQIPEPARTLSFLEATLADVFILVGTTGEVMPANLIPEDAHRRGVFIIEINTEPSLYTDRVTDLYIEGRASETLEALAELLVPGVSGHTSGE